MDSGAAMVRVGLDIQDPDLRGVERTKLKETGLECQCISNTRFIFKTIKHTGCWSGPKPPLALGRLDNVLGYSWMLRVPGGGGHVILWFLQWTISPNTFSFQSPDVI